MDLAKIIREEYGQLNENLSSSKNELMNFLNSFGYNASDFYLDEMELKLYPNINHIKHINIVINRLEKHHHWFLSGAESDMDDYENNVGEIKKHIKYNLEQMVEEYGDGYDGEELVTLFFEPKFSNTINKEDVPDFMYHITDINNLKNIKRHGLLLKNKNKLAYHPKRIYLFIKRDGAEKILYNMNFDINNPIILKIDVRKFKDDNDFYIDPKLKDGGVYVLNNIPPNLIISYEEMKLDYES